MSPDQLKAIFTYHAPHGDQAQRYEQLRAGGRVLAELVNNLAPESAEKTLAIRRIQEAVMYANAAIACNEPAVVHTCSRCGRPILPDSGYTINVVGAGERTHLLGQCPQPDAPVPPGCTNSTGPASKNTDAAVPHGGGPL